MSEFTEIRVLHGFESERREGEKHQYRPYLIHRTNSYKKNLLLLEDGCFYQPEPAQALATQLAQKLGLSFQESISNTF